MTTEKPHGMSDREAQLWRTCVGVVLAREAEIHERLARTERSRTISLLARARQIADEGRLVPPAPLAHGALGKQLASGIAWLAANVEAGGHVAVDREARAAFERLLLEHESAHPETAEIGWWHSLEGHTCDLDDPEGRCTCGQRVGGFLTLAELHHQAREKYDAALRMPASAGARWEWTR